MRPTAKKVVVEYATDATACQLNPWLGGLSCIAQHSKRARVLHGTAFEISNLAFGQILSC